MLAIAIRSGINLNTYTNYCGIAIFSIITTISAISAIYILSQIILATINMNKGFKLLQQEVSELKAIINSKEG